jgi:hypothetical protein
MALAVLPHAIRQIAQTPIFALFDLAAIVGNELGEGVGEGVDLSAGDVLARDEHVFVKRHAVRSLMADHDPERERRSGRAGRSRQG